MTKDDKQLREAITEAADYHLPLVAIDRLTALFQKEQIQLVSELEGEKAYHRCKEGWFEYVPLDTLEHKKQELEGKQ